ncbi:uncharacterized protein [Branchiostoma lanceolatum]|uniref:uncharacterized protein n=1 Tax=Branchiostoma lanceolatum TaxID=7740 RepID=UPI0034529E9B
MSCSKSLKATDLHSSWKVEFDWKDFPEELVQRVYFVKHDILGLPDADKTAAIVALAQHGVNIKEYADTLVDSEAEGDMNKSIEANEVIAGEKRKLCAASTMLSPLCDADDDDDFAPTTNKR